MNNTREQFLDKAETLFAERGFYGVSIAAVADELGLTKQALLHHFGSKEKMYGQVLRRISERFLQLSTAESEDDPRRALVAYLLRLNHHTGQHPEQTALLIRELLDNKRRADTARSWYLQPFLNDLIKLLKGVPGWQSCTDGQALATVYQFLGAINYYHVSKPTLAGIFGSSKYKQLERQFPKQLEALITATVDTDFN